MMTAPAQDMVDAFLAHLVEEIASRVVEKLRDDQPAGDRMLKLSEVASRLGLSEKSVRDLVNGRDGNAPKLASLKVGPSQGARVVEAAELDRYIAERRAAG